MKRALTITALVVLGLMSSVLPAHANIWDWMEEWSGPGRFRGKVNGSLTACSKPFSSIHWYELDKTTCLFFDVHAFAAKAKPSFPSNATTTFVDVGPTWRLMRPLEVGAGVGFMTAAGNKATTRPTLTAFRAAAKPVLLVAEAIHAPEMTKLKGYYDAEEHWYVRALLNAPKVYFKYNVILGHLRGEDLGVSDTTFDRTFDHFASWGVVFDVGALFPVSWTGLR